MKIKFNWVELEGFRSWVLPMRFNLDRSGLNMIKGINGAGKTSIFEGVYWSVYGENLKDSNNDKLPTWPEFRTSQWKGTKVTTCFSTPDDIYYVTRHIEFKGTTYDVKGENYLMLAKGEEPQLIGDFRNKAEMQSEINRILGMNANVFINSVLFGQRMNKLVQQSGSDKRELFETLFETEWVPAMKVKADEDIKQWDSDLLKLGWDINKSLTEIEHLTDKLSTAKTVVAIFEEGRANRILTKQTEQGMYTDYLASIEKDLMKAREKLAAVDYNADKHIKLDEDYKEYTKLYNEAKLWAARRDAALEAVKTKGESAKKTIELRENILGKLKEKHIEGNCPYCEQELRPGNKLEINHKAEIAEATKNLKDAKLVLKEAEKGQIPEVYKTAPELTYEQLDKMLTKIETELATFDGTYTEYIELQKQEEKSLSAQVTTKKDLCRVLKEIKEIKAEKPPVVDTKQLEYNIDMEKLNLNMLQDEKPVLEKKIEIAKWWSSKALSSGGIKAYVFKAMLTTLNQCVKKYGDRLGASLEFSIDLTKASKPFTTNCSLGDKLNKDYKDFSGGEKQKLDIALLFAMHDLISMNTDMNILIMDEVFEGLSEDGETAVFELIRSKAEEGKSVYVITHSAVLDSLYANTIEFENKQGNTLILN